VRTVLGIATIPAALAFAAGLALLLLPGTPRPADAATPAESGFADARIASQRSPTALAFTPDGRMLVTSQSGSMNVYRQDGTLLEDGALNLGARVCANSERGLLGIAVDPQFVTNGYIYVFYTFNKSGQCPTGQPTNPANPVNRVSRFVLDSNNNTSGEQVLVDNMPSPAGNHNAGDLKFGKDGNLYVSIGDGGCDYANDSGCAGQNDAARDKHVLTGKVLRITREGGVPPDNPFASSGGSCARTGKTTPGQHCKETYAWGLRNPFRFATDPDASGVRLFINDVGQGKWEEVDEGRPGADYGWNLREGFCAKDQTTGCRTTPGATVNGLTDPVHSYGREIGKSITGAAFVPDGVWPSSYNTSYLFGDSVAGKIFRLAPNGSGGYARTEFATELGPVISLAFGPFGNGRALYYTTYANGGEIHRLAYTGAPTAALTATPDSGPTPLTVSFDGSGSRGAGTLTYLWDFDGDGGTDTTTTDPKTEYGYTEAGTITASLKVRDGRGAESSPATFEVYPGNNAPAPQITAPAGGKLFRVGEGITLSGSASDPDDGTLPGSALRWEVRRYHNDDHYHPWFSGTGNDLRFTAPPPEDLSATGAGNYLEVRLTATDSKGLSRTVTRRLEPRRVGVTLATAPLGLRLSLNGTTFEAPRTVTSWEGYGLNVGAAGQKDRFGRLVRFYNWSDGGRAAHTVRTPASAATYTAKFRYVPALTLSARDTTLRAGERARLVGRLRTATGAVPGKKTVTVWRSTDGGKGWRRLGEAGYNRTGKTYNFTTYKLGRDSLFQMRFAGDASYTADKSGRVRVSVRR